MIFPPQGLQDPDAATLAQATLDSAYSVGDGVIAIDGDPMELVGSGSISPYIFAVSGTKTVASAADAAWNALYIRPVVSLSGTTNVTNVAGFNMVSLSAPTITDAGTIASVALASTLYIGGAPTGSGLTITEACALHVDSGTTRLDGTLDHNGTAVGFYGATPVAQQTGVAVSAAGVHAALVNLGLITA